MDYPLGRCLECGSKCHEYRAWCNCCAPDMWRYGKMKEAKYCTERPIVEYVDADDHVFRAVTMGNHIRLTTSHLIGDNHRPFVVDVYRPDMQDLIDSLQAFYDQEKGE